MRFRINSYFLDLVSDFWREHIRNLDTSEDAPGSHESKPFLLDEDPNDFAQFLWVFYNP